MCLVGGRCRHCINLSRSVYWQWFTVCEVWNNCYFPMPPFHMANFKPVSKPVSNRFNAGAFTWPLGVAVNYVMSFVFVYRLGVK